MWLCNFSSTKRNKCKGIKWNFSLAMCQSMRQQYIVERLRQYNSERREPLSKLEKRDDFCDIFLVMYRKMLVFLAYKKKKQWFIIKRILFSPCNWHLIKSALMVRGRMKSVYGNTLLLCNYWLTHEWQSFYYRKRNDD